MASSELSRLLSLSVSGAEFFCTFFAHCISSKFMVIHLKGLGGTVSSYTGVCDTAGNERRDSHRETKDGVRANSEIR